MERSDRDRSERPLEIERTEQEVPLVSCVWCERLHPGEHPLSVCPACKARFSTMRSLEMSGSFPLSDEAIEDTVGQTSPGNYALGYMDGGSFVVFYVGRSDCDVRQRLRDWVGMPSQYASFASPAKAPWRSHRRGPLPMGAPTSGQVANVETSYTHFAYSYARSADDAYAKEWRNYDAFGGADVLDNGSEPTSAGHESMDRWASAAADLEA